MRAAFVGITSSILLIASPNVAFSTENMVTLYDYAKKLDPQIEDDSAVHFVFLRCSALFTLLSDLGSNTPSFREMADEFSVAGKFFYNKAIAAGAHREYAFDMENKMWKSYEDRALNSRARTNNFMTDPVLNADLRYCGDLYRAFK